MPFTTMLARATSSGYNRGSHLAGGALGGLSVGAILLIMAIIFVCSYVYFHKKAKKQFIATNKPISHARIFGKALLCCTIVGFLLLLCSGDSSDGGSDSSSGGDSSGDVEAQQANVQMPPVAVPPVTGPNNFWTPLQTAAADPVQG